MSARARSRRTARAALDPRPATLLPAPGRRSHAVGEVVRHLDRTLRAGGQRLWIRGEVSGWKRSRSGHYFFVLHDREASLSCTLWRQAAAKLKWLPRDGEQVEAYATAGLFRRRGELRMEITRIEATGRDGPRDRERDELLTRLRGEGCLDEDRKRALPELPESIGIVTSADGAAIGDIRRVLERRGWWGRTVLSPCRVEGAEAADEIVRAIERVSRAGVDLVILARGGGSRESLWGFDVEPVARAILACPVPVVSAVGHEADVSVADLVADVRAATPTAGAEMAVPDAAFLRDRLEEALSAIRTRVERESDRAEASLSRSMDAVLGSGIRRVRLLDREVAAVGGFIEARSPSRLVAHAAARLRVLERSIHRAAQRRCTETERRTGWLAGRLHRGAAVVLREHEHRVAWLSAALEARDPARYVERGYAIVRDARTGEPVTAAADIVAGHRLDLEFRDGRAEVEAVEIRTNKEGVRRGHGDDAEPRQEEARRTPGDAAGAPGDDPRRDGPRRPGPGRPAGPLPRRLSVDPVGEEHPGRGPRRDGAADERGGRTAGADVSEDAVVQQTDLDLGA